MLSQELGVRLKAMPSEAMVMMKFPDLVQGANHDIDKLKELAMGKG